MSILKEQLDQSFKDKSYVEHKDLVQIIEDEQKRRMTSVIFKDDGVLSQLHQAQKDCKDGISTYSDSEEEFAQLLKEIGNEK